MNEVTKRSQRLAWRITVGAFLCMALWPLWSARFPPMQDYPQHLFQTQVLRAHNDPAFDYNRYYEFRLRPVYATFFLTTLFFAKFVPIETAGKLSLSLYPVLIAIIVVRLGRRLGREVAPWGALLFFPLAFNQQYFLGNINYFLSLPLLILILLDYEDLLGGTLGAWPFVRHSFWQVALFMTHPFTFDVYVSLAVVAAFMARRKTREFKIKVSASLGVAIILLVASWVKSEGTSSPGFSAIQGITWLSPKDTMEFFASMFNGMQGVGSADYVAWVLWGSVFSVVLGALIVDWRERRHPPLLYVVFFILTIAGLIILPSGIGTYSYINLRTAAIIYFLIALLVAQVRFKGWLACCLAALLGLCMIDSMAKQARISAEVKEILPIVRRIPPNSRILPLVFDRGSPELDRHWFDPHLHDHNYYHILVGGGYNPYLPRDPLNPVHYKKGEERPAPSEYHPGQFSWEDDSADYQYFLIRSMPKGAEEYMSKTCNKICVSGEWTLFERKSQ